MTRHALILGATGGIGSAISDLLSQGDWEVTGLSRADGLDFDAPDSVAKVLEAHHGPFDLIFIATGALEIDGIGPEKALKQLTPETLAAQFRVNTIGPALVMAHVPRLLAKAGTVATLTARVGSIGDNRLGGWHSYRAAKAALNQIMHGAAIELARSHKAAICVALHPGTVATGLTETHGKGHDKLTPSQAAAHLLAVLGGLTPEDSGQFFDWKGERVVW
ncbi:MAG TPA: C factor, cell signaling protein [Maritimibacter sp.]|nr:C factor, cell signaling protein [Maritimibacter sp.]